MRNLLITAAITVSLNANALAATLRMEWADVSTNALSLYTAQEADIDIYVDLLTGEELSGIVFSNTSMHDVLQIATSVNASGWSNGSIDGELGSTPQYLSFAASSAGDNLSGPGAFLIGTQTIRLDSPVEETAFNITVDHDTVLFLDESAAEYTWDARYNTSYAGYVAYGNFGNAGWTKQMGNGDQPEPNPLIIQGTGSPDTLTISPDSFTVEASTSGITLRTLTLASVNK